MCILVNRNGQHYLHLQSVEQNTVILVKWILAKCGKRSFEWSSEWTVKGTSSRTARLRKRLVELDGLCLEVPMCMQLRLEGLKQRTGNVFVSIQASLTLFISPYVRFSQSALCFPQDMKQPRYCSKLLGKIGAEVMTINVFLAERNKLRETNRFSCS